MEVAYCDDKFSAENYYKDGKYVGRVEYTIDEHRRYWICYEEWRSGNGDFLVTQYYQKNESRDFLSISITANYSGAIKCRYGRHMIEFENGWSASNDWYDIVEYYPTGQIAILDRRSNGRMIDRYEYAPNGRLYQYQTNWDDNFLTGYYLNSYT